MTRSIDVDSIADALVRNAAPTLAGIKPASLFTFPGRFVGGARERAAVLSRREAFLNALDACRAELAASGVLIRVLVWRHCGPVPLRVIWRIRGRPCPSRARVIA